MMHEAAEEAASIAEKSLRPELERAKAELAARSDAHVELVRLQLEAEKEAYADLFAAEAVGLAEAVEAERRGRAHAEANGRRAVELLTLEKEAAEAEARLLERPS